LDQKVYEYIEKQKSAQREIMQKIRAIFLETLPNSEEKMTWGVATYAKGKFYIAAMKSRVHVGFAITGLNPEEVCLFEGSGQTMRHIKIPTLDTINEEQLVKLIKMVDKKAFCQQC